jgi:predicted RNase H-like HicB family nuclease
MFYHFKIHRDRDGYWAECIELKGCVTEGDTLEELKKNMQEALNLYLDEPYNANITFPMPDRKIKGKNLLEVPVHLCLRSAVFPGNAAELHSWLIHEPYSGSFARLSTRCVKTSEPEKRIEGPAAGRRPSSVDGGRAQEEEQVPYDGRVKKTPDSRSRPRGRIRGTNVRTGSLPDAVINPLSLEDGRVAELLLDPEELVVLGDAL